MPRLYGYAPIGKRCYDYQNWREHGRKNVIGAIINNTFVTQTIFECSVDSDVFYAWTTQDLIPKLEKFDKQIVIVMDNATFHRRKDILDAITDAGHIVEFQPAYSPELNPIEKKWAQAKHIIRKLGCSVEDVFKYHLPIHFIVS